MSTYHPSQISKILIPDLEDIVYRYLSLNYIMTQFRNDDEFREKLIKKYHPEILKYRTDFYRNKINWSLLSMNPNAVYLLKQNFEKIDWHDLSYNPNAIDLLEQNPKKINWGYLSENPNAISLLKQNPKKIIWDLLIIQTN